MASHKRKCRRIPTKKTIIIKEKMVSERDVKLVGGWASPFVVRVRIALNLKSVDYEFLQETVGRKSELLLKSNPVYKKIPVLIHNGNPICESMIIVRYIDEVFSSSAPALLPADPYERAAVCFWAAYIDDKLVQGFFGSVLGKTEEAKVEGREQISAGLLLLEEALYKCNNKGSGGFFGGDSIGYIDIALGCFLSWFEALGKMYNITFIDEEKTPLLAGWSEIFLAKEAVREVMPKTDDLIEFVKLLQARV